MKQTVTIVMALGLVLLMGSGASAQYPPSAPSIGLSQTEVLPGQPITVTGDGWLPGSEVTITLHCPGGYAAVLGTATVGDDETFSTQVTVPTDAPPGECVLSVTGVGADGQPMQVDSMLTIVAPAAPGPPAPAPPAAPVPATLVPTGGSFAVTATVGLLLVLLGALSLAMAQRRRTA